MCGAAGTLMVGLFATDGGLFYGGGFAFLGVQALGVVSVIAWVAVTMTIVFFLIKKTVGLRVSKEEEIAGLDSREHGIESSYADFMPAVEHCYDADLAMEAPVSSGTVGINEAVPVQVVSAPSETPACDVKITKVSILMNKQKFDALKAAMNRIGVTGMTVSQVLGCGIQKGATEYYRGVPVEMNLLPKIKVEIVVCKVPVRTVIDTAKKVLYTGHIGDGKIVVYDVENVIKVRTGEEGYDAMQDTDE